VFDWQTDGPVAGVDPRAFTLRLEGRQALAAGAYRVSLEAAGTVRLWIDGRLVHERALAMASAAKWPMVVGAAARLPVRLEYAPAGDARVGLRWDAVTGLEQAYLPRALQP
jgi:hypothetical protein